MKLFTKKMDSSPDENTGLLYDVAGEDYSGTDVVTSNVVESKAGTGIFGATFIVINAAMGAGMLNFPNAFKNAGGILPGMFMQLVLCLFNNIQ